MVTKRTAGLPLICLVCGDDARGINFDVMSCMSCKTFFRRHAQKTVIKLECKLDHECEITKRTRSACAACRLKKCFTLGMNQQLLRRWSVKCSKSKPAQVLKSLDKNGNYLPKPLPLNLLRNDLSTLTKEEWNLLSNIVHTYDKTNIIPDIKYQLEQQSTLPPKVRSKVSTSVDVLKYFLSALQPFIEDSPYFQNLSIDLRQALIQHNYDTASTMNCVFIIREMSALDNATFLTSCDVVYGYDIFKYSTHFVSRLESNSTLIKILLLTLAFSTNCSIVNPDDPKNLRTITNVIAVFNIQNILVTMFWKYLIYQYGFIGGVRRFDSLIKYVLELLHSMNERANAQHEQMIDTIVEKTTRSLTIDDQKMY
ncbi:unnamed protein product [Adineta steineri]|uniref:Nuclear receptor domain-containing protein n=1 Tax=Adineta steineri TaxID=433720 RepID=A0A815M1B0_9BILA|nr:unnamed protein product [Adineta steineri]CAF3933149.1 unnamed protein product [Adineta steineri]